MVTPMTNTTLTIDGMTCGHCVMTVKTTLDRLDGVTVERVSIGTAAVSYDPAVTSPERIADAVSAAGYAATPTA